MRAEPPGHPIARGWFLTHCEIPPSEFALWTLSTGGVHQWNFGMFKKILLKNYFSSIDFGIGAGIIRITMGIGNIAMHCNGHYNVYNGHCNGLSEIFAF